MATPPFTEAIAAAVFIRFAAFSSCTMAAVAFSRPPSFIILSGSSAKSNGLSSAARSVVVLVASAARATAAVR